MLGFGAAAILPLQNERVRLSGAGSHVPVQFTDITAQAGLLRARNISGSPDNKQFLLEEMGCGVAFFDYDNDGWLDVFLVNGSSFDPAVRDSKPTSYLFRNNRDGTFTDVSQKSGLTHSGWGQACCIGDYDNDGSDDLFVSYSATMSFITTMATALSQTSPKKPEWLDPTAAGARAVVFSIMIAMAILTCLSRTT